MKEINLSKIMGQAINDYGMIDPNDRIVVGLSGGMDSLALLLLLNSRLKRIPVRYSLFPVLVDNLNGESEEHNKRIGKLTGYIISETGHETHVIHTGTMKKLTEGDSRKRDVCFLCAQKRRYELIRYAFSINCTKIALGHHKDDIIETSLMNLFYKHELSSMVPKLELFGGKMFIMRPLAYIQKTQIEDYIYTKEKEVPVFGEVCPSNILRRDLRRSKIREIVDRLSKEIPHLKNNVFASYRNPKNDYLLDRFFDPKTSGSFKRP